MSLALGALPTGAPPWLQAAGGVVFVIVALFGQYPVKAAADAVKARRAGMARRETEAREQTRTMRREHLELTIEAITEENIRLRQINSVLDHHKGQLWDHVGTLEAHIIDGKGAPPPRRPVLTDRPPGIDQWADYDDRGQRRG